MTKFKKTSCKKLKSYAKEEKESYKDYKSRGFKKQAMDEKSHSEFFARMADIRGCNK